MFTNKALLLLNIVVNISKSIQQGLNACTIGNNPCSTNAECYVETLFIGAPKCRCPYGFEGDGLLTGTGCRDIDECKLGTHTCSQNNQRCINTIGGYECECLNGYRKHENRANECVDIDECLELSACPSSTICINLEGSFKCECLNRELIFDQGRCRPINKCNDYNGRLNDCSQLCVSDKDERGKCECSDGYRLHSDGKTCIDINECLESNPCDLSISSCINTLGSYVCDCFRSAGYITSPVNNKICINLNECEDEPMICGDLNMCCKDLAPPDKYECISPILRVEEKNESVKYQPFNDDDNNIEHYENIPDQRKYREIKIVRSSRIKREVESFQGSYPVSNDIYNNGCFESDIEYPGYTLQVLRSLSTALDCQLQCQLDLGCDFFSFDMFNKLCFFKAARYEAKVVPGIISGPKYCTEKKVKSGYRTRSQDSSASLLRKMSFNNGLANRTSQISDYKCPAGFSHAYEVWRKQKNKKAFEVIQNQFGTRQVNAINPIDISEGIQSNANFMAKQIYQWYDTISGVPGSISNTTRKVDQNKPIIEPYNTNPGFIAGGIPPPPRMVTNANSAFYYPMQNQIESGYGHPIYSTVVVPDEIGSNSSRKKVY
ncbi:fibrillin 2 syndatyly ems [Cryptosporidium xiaoi]|uniref:Fibrillin 2 syndatyly ems n=1 Tax=Cryptosporidium xiaoi TaxID=659607 RepID=A0AAV9Y2A1_9CRYT